MKLLLKLLEKFLKYYKGKKKKKKAMGGRIGRKMGGGSDMAK